MTTISLDLLQFAYCSGVNREFALRYHDVRSQQQLLKASVLFVDVRNSELSYANYCNQLRHCPRNFLIALPD